MILQVHRVKFNRWVYEPQVAAPEGTSFDEIVALARDELQCLLRNTDAGDVQVVSIERMPEVRVMVPGEQLRDGPGLLWPAEARALR